MSKAEYKSHYSVMLKDCMAFLNDAAKNKTPQSLADMTFGAGGHTMAMAKAFSQSKVYSTDQDPEALANGEKILKEQKLWDQVTLLNMNFENFPSWANANLEKGLDGIIMDLGVSSHHFDSFERGFSFREDAPLDMRMACDNDEIPTAAWHLNNLEEEEIANIIFNYGEDRLSRRIARKICEERLKAPIETTKQLENICFHAYPPNMRHKRPHPATRTFQALRIHVNEELRVLEDTLPKLYDLLADDGQLMVISFHSLEDRIVKRTFKDIFQSDKNAAKILTKRPLTPSDEELEENPRSRSAKLRVIQKVNPGGVEHGGKKTKEKKNRKK